MDYDENVVLTRYIWNHYPHLFTDFELHVRRVIDVRTKVVLYSKQNVDKVALDEFLANPNDTQNIAEQYQEARRKFGDTDEPLVNAALKDGVESYRQEVCKRILREHNDKVFINRCPKCQRIVRTPEAKLCLWCGHSWFND